ncbi:MAG: class I SAM-dependent methyltransferase [Candidatus Hodarchaeota archaeon]
MTNFEKQRSLELESGERPLIENSSKSIIASTISRYKFASNFMKVKTVLDIGCGTGVGLDFLAKSADMVIGIDYSEESINYAIKNNNKNNLMFRVMDCRNLKFNDGEFDLVTSFELIEHIYEHEQFYQEVKRVLKPNGIFICSTPNTKVFSPKGKYLDFHVHEFTLSEFKTALEKYFNDVTIFGQFYNSAEAKIFLHPVNKYIYRLKQLSGPLKFFFPLIRSLIVYIFSAEKPSEVTENNFPIIPQNPETAPTLIGVARNN